MTSRSSSRPTKTASGWNQLRRVRHPHCQRHRTGAHQTAIGSTRAQAKPAGAAQPTKLQQGRGRHGHAGDAARVIHPGPSHRRGRQFLLGFVISPSTSSGPCTQMEQRFDELAAGYPSGHVRFPTGTSSGPRPPTSPDAIDEVGARPAAKVGVLSICRREGLRTPLNAIVAEGCCDLGDVEQGRACTSMTTSGGACRQRHPRPVEDESGRFDPSALACQLEGGLTMARCGNGPPTAVGDHRRGRRAQGQAGGVQPAVQCREVHPNSGPNVLHLPQWWVRARTRRSRREGAGWRCRFSSCSTAGSSGARWHGSPAAPSGGGGDSEDSSSSWRTTTPR